VLQGTRIGTVSFQRESGKPLSFVDVLYVPGMTKNLISVSTLEDKGYEVTFRKGKVFILGHQRVKRKRTR
jgi:hypothetical protein